MILLLGGTSEANAIGDLLKRMKCPFVLTVTTDYGVQMAKEHSQQVMKRLFTHADLVDFIQEKGINCMIDSTHPHASAISSLAQSVSKTLNCPYLRYERPSNVLGKGEKISYVETPEAAALLSRQFGKRIFITGSKHINLYQKLLGDLDLFVRVIPSPQVIASVLGLGIPSDHIVAMKGPFSEALNLALFQAFDIEVLITKESGEVGGYSNKVKSAQESGIHTIVIKRPPMQYSHLVQDFESLRIWINENTTQGKNHEI